MNSRNIFLTALILIIPLTLIILLHFLNTGSGDRQISFTPQQTQLYKIDDANNNPINILATTLPQFAVSLADQKFENLWQAHAEERQTLVESNVTNAKGDTNLDVRTTFDDTHKQIVVTPQMQNKVKPGLYTLNVKVKTVQGEDITITQDFRWGVLAINTNKATYKAGDTVKIGMAVLDDFGRTKCIAKNGQILLSTAKIWLTIISPSGNTQNLSTDDESITGSKSCADRSITNDPDFFGQVTPQETGKYTIHMDAQTILGKESIDDFFTVSNAPQAFDIERSVFPTRIYPVADYPVNINVTPNENYSGSVTDIVPSSFTITQISDGGTVSDDGEFKTITWQADWQKDQAYGLSYTIHFPPVTPEFYLIGPLHIGQFSEGKEWQIASDSLFQLVQEVSATGTGASPFNASFSNGVTQNNLLVMNCERSANNSWSSSISGWSTAYRSGNSANTPRIAQYYRVVNAGTAGTKTFGCTASNTSGEMAIDLMEFSGNSTSAPLDKTAAPLTGRTCNTSSNTTNTIAPVGSDELFVSESAAAHAGFSVSSHTSIGGSSIGFCDSASAGCSTSGGFDGTTDSYDSGYGEDISSGTISDKILFSGNANCTNAMAAYKPPLTITQGNYQFFQNANSTTPGSAIGSISTPLTLNQPNQAFRVRMLLDVNSNVGNLVQNTADFTLMYATLSAGLTCATASYDPVAMPVDGTDIAFNSNPAVGISGGFISANTGSDPSDASYTRVPESYYEDDFSDPNGPANGDITNDQADIANLQAGEWDFSLIDNTSDSKTNTYCLEIQNSGGTPFDAYTHIPQVTTLNNDVVIRGSPSGTILKGSPGTTGTMIR